MSTQMMTAPSPANALHDEGFWTELDSWHEVDEVVSAAPVLAIARPARPAEAVLAYTELEPTTVDVESQQEMRFGIQKYTSDQAHVIELAVRRRRALDASPLPIDD